MLKLMVWLWWLGCFGGVGSLLNSEFDLCCVRPPTAHCLLI